MSTEHGDEQLMAVAGAEQGESVQLDQDMNNAAGLDSLTADEFSAVFDSSSAFQCFTHLDQAE